MITVIPSCGESTYLPGVVESAAYHSTVHVVFNNMDKEDVQPFMNLVASRGAEPWHWDAGIYAIWNWAIDLGRKSGENVAILNDDLVFADPHSFLGVDTLLRDGPWAAIGWDYWHPDHRTFQRVREAEGTFRKQGIGGFAFAVNPQRVGSIPDGYCWWGGDDDLFNQAMSAGHPIGIAMGLGVRHDTSTSARVRPSVYENLAQDQQLLLDRWGDAW